MSCGGCFLLLGGGFGIWRNVENMCEKIFMTEKGFVVARIWGFVGRDRWDKKLEGHL